MSPAVSTGTATAERRLPAPNAMDDLDFGLAFKGLQLPPDVRVRSLMVGPGPSLPKGEEFLPKNVRSQLDKRLKNWIDTLDERTLYDVAVRALAGGLENGARDVVQIPPEQLRNILFKNLVFTAPAKGL